MILARQMCLYTARVGIVLREPSVAAVDKGTGAVKGVGIEAQRMLGRTPGILLPYALCATE